MPETTITKIDFNSKAPRWILYIGLTLFLISRAVHLAFPDIFIQYESTDSVMSMLASMPMLIVTLYATLIAPIVEELGFRGWQLRYHFFKWLSCIIVSAYSILTFGYIIGIIIGLIHVSLIFYKPKRQKRILGILYTSLVFAFIHWRNYGAIETQIIATITIFGIGLVMSYITWRFSFVWSIILHSVYNGILILIFFNFSSEIHIKTPEYEIKSIAKLRLENCHYTFEDDKIMAQNDLNTIIGHWIEKYNCDDMQCFYIHIKNTPLLDLSITMSPIADKNQVLDTLISTYGFKMDTVHSSKYILTMPDNDDTPIVWLDKKDMLFNQRLEEIANTLRQNFNLPIYCDKLYADRIVRISTIYINKISTEEFISALREGGIKLEKDPTQTIMGVKLIPKE